MSLHGTIARFKTGTYTVTRTAADTYINGLRVVGSASTLSIDASIQPVTGRELFSLPEARRTQDLRVFWTSIALVATPNPDKITIDGEVFEIFQIYTYTILAPVPFYRVYCARQTVP